MAEFLTFVTRTCKRPHMLLKNMESVRTQTDDDWKQIILVDDKKRGKFYANKMLAAHKGRVKGQYVYILDDDHHLIIPDFVTGIRNIVKKKNPDIIMVKCKIRYHGILPRRWKQKPRSAYIDTGCFVIRGTLWRKHIGAFGVPVCGDYHFINRLWKVKGIKIEWWDKIVAEDLRETMQWG